MSEELAVLKLVSQRLEKLGAPYMITGSIAANYYAVPRMTRDIDIVIELMPQQTEEIFEIFMTDFYIDQDVLKAEVARKGMFNIIHKKFVVKVDFIVKKDTEYHREEFDRRRGVQVEETHLFITAPEDLIISKLQWAKESDSQMHRQDAKNIMASVKGLDHTYLEEWTARLGLSELLDEAKK